MRNISFSATKEQIRARQKHVTRRGNAKGPTWKNVKPGDHLMVVEKAQGLKKGERVVQMGEINVIWAEYEPLNRIIEKPYRLVSCSILSQYWDLGINRVSEMALEGFPHLTAEQFVEMFCTMNNCTPETEVTRILFDYVGGAE